MWEICTLGTLETLMICCPAIFDFTGSFPYPSISSKDLLSHIRNGNRLSRPENCSDQL